MADAKWNTANDKSQYGEQNTIEIISGTKSASLLVYQGLRYKPEIIAEKTAAAVPASTVKTEEVYDQLLLFLQEKGVGYNYKDCYMLQESDLKDAIVIPILK